MIALRDEAATVYLIQDGRVVAHQRHELCQVHAQFHHHGQGVLYGRETGFGGEVVVGELFRYKMRGMVGADGVNQSAMQGIP